VLRAANRGTAGLEGHVSSLTSPVEIGQRTLVPSDTSRQRALLGLWRTGFVRKTASG